MNLLFFFFHFRFSTYILLPSSFNPTLHVYTPHVVSSNSIQTQNKKPKQKLPSSFFYLSIVDLLYVWLRKLNNDMNLFRSGVFILFLFKKIFKSGPISTTGPTAGFDPISDSITGFLVQSPVLWQPGFCGHPDRTCVRFTVQPVGPTDPVRFWLPCV